MARWQTLLAAAVLSAGCGVGPASDPEAGITTPPLPPATTTTAPPPAVIRSGELRVIVPPDSHGNLPADLIVGCRSGPTFQMSDLDAIEPLEDADNGDLVGAIEPFLSSEEGAYWPQDQWLILRKTPDEVILVHPGEEGLAFMTTRFIGGEWQWSGSSSGGSCPLYYQVPDELNPVDWRLDPANIPIQDSTVIQVLATERECVDGREIGDRLLDPDIVMTADEVRIALAAEPPPGDAFTCPGNPETRYSIALPAPLGDRKIVQGLAIGIDLEDYLP